MELESRPSNIEDKITSSYRTETIVNTLHQLDTSLNTLGIDTYDLPNTKILFKENEASNEGKENLLLGHVEVYPSKFEPVEIVYDKRFSTEEKEQIYLQELHTRGIAYPGLQITLRHEFAHIAMWSITNQERQAATRTIDEGWAKLVENTTETLPIESTKQELKQLQITKPEIFNRCFDFKNVTTYEEKLNTAESRTGQALLLWIHQEYGVEKMIELIQKSPEYQKRNDELPKNKFEPTILNKEMHKTYTEYYSLLNDIKLNKIPQDTVKSRLREIEGKQFEYALLETTNSLNINEVRDKFMKWING
ncbi:MAG: hypothetical protein ACOX6Q_01430 [Candidatus Dojkabacteria bacterium]|jgi:hypothetical protein